MNEHISYGTDLSKKPKQDENLLKNVVFVYACLIISLTLSLSVNSIEPKETPVPDTTAPNINTTGIVLDVYLTILHVFASAILIALFIYLHINRNQTFEEAKKENSKSSEIHYSMCGEKVGLYLRFGVVLIGSLSLIHIGLSSARLKSYGGQPCFNPSSILSSLTEIIFFIIQTVFILRYHSVVILKNTKIIKFGLYTIVFINIAIWEIASIMKIKFSSNINKQSNNSCLDQVLDKIHLYFLPAVSEYCVICMAIMYEIMKRLGILSLIETSHDNKSEDKFWRIRKTVAGVAIGIVIVLCCMALTIVVILLDKKEENNSTVFIIHNTEEITMYLFTMVILILALLKTKKLKFSFAYLLNNVDKNLLFVSCFLSITFAVLLSTFCFQFSIENIHHRTRAISAVLEIFQIILQTYFIQDAFYRCTENKDQQRSKPGQCYLGILIGCNFGMWIFKSFQLKNGDPFFHKTSSSTTSENQSLLIFFVYLTLPLSILYRYHSSACLADVFSKIYQGEVCRFEGLLRAEGFDKCGMVVQEDAKPSTPQIVIQGASPNVSRPRAITLPEIPTYVPPPKRSKLSKKMTRRETIKNFEAAKLRVLSSQFSHNIVSKKLSATVAPNQNLSTGSINEIGNERSPTLSVKGKNHQSHSDTEMPTVKQLFMANMFNSSLRRRNSEDEQSKVTSRSVKFNTNAISEHNED